MGLVKEVLVLRVMCVGVMFKLMEVECFGVWFGGVIWVWVGIMVGRVGVFVLDWEVKVNVKMKGCSLGICRVIIGDGNFVEKG